MTQKEIDKPSRAPRERPGGRTARTRMAVLQATSAILIETGAENLTWQTLAARSGVNRSTLYRRWGTLGAVVGDLASHFADELHYPQTGTLEGDLEHAINQIRDLLTPDNCRLVQALIGWHDDIVQTEMSAFWAARRMAIGEVLRRHGIEVDVHVMVRLMAGPLYYSALIEDRSPTIVDTSAALTATMAWIHNQTGM